MIKVKEGNVIDAVLDGECQVIDGVSIEEEKDWRAIYCI